MLQLQQDAEKSVADIKQKLLDISKNREMKLQNDKD